MIVSKIASSLGLELPPNADEFRKALLSDSFSLKEKWLSGTAAQFENYFTFGLISEQLFLRYRSYLPSWNPKNSKGGEELKGRAEKLLSLCAEEGIPKEIIDDYLTGMKNSFGVPMEKKTELYREVNALGLTLDEMDRTYESALRHNTTEIGDTKAVHDRFVRQVSDTLLGIDSSESGPGSS